MGSQSVSLAFLCLTQMSVFTRSELNLKLIGGTEAQPHAFPYQVGIALREPVERSGWCGGALISHETVITAAHCLKGIRRATVFIGAHDVRNISSSPNAVVMDVDPSHIVVHARWSPRYVLHDIALIRLPAVVPFSETVHPIALAAADTTVAPNQTLVVTGWGRTSRNNTVGRPSTLHVVALRAESDDKCRELFFYYDSTFNICMEGDPTKSTCRGDSGGPIVATDEQAGTSILIGITSYGRKCENVSVLTKVSSYLDWISENIVHRDRKKNE